MKKQADENQRSFMEMEKLRAAQADDLRARLDAADQKYYKQHEEAIKYKAKLDSAAERITALEQQLRTAQDQLDTVLKQRAVERPVDLSAAHFSVFGKEKQLERAWPFAVDLR